MSIEFIHVMTSMLTSVISPAMFCPTLRALKAAPLSRCEQGKMLQPARWVLWSTAHKIIWFYSSTACICLSMHWTHVNTCHAKKTYSARCLQTLGKVIRSEQPKKARRINMFHVTPSHTHMQDQNAIQFSSSSHCTPSSPPQNILQLAPNYGRRSLLMTNRPTRRRLLHNVTV